MTEQERERLIDARIHVERIRDADGDWVGADMEWYESVHGLSAADVDEIATEAYRRHFASRQPATPDLHGTPLTAEDANAAGFGLDIPARMSLSEHQATQEEVDEQVRRFLEENNPPRRAVYFPAQQSHVFTPDTERMLARLINPTTIGERLCRAYLMGDEDSLKVLLDGIQLGEIEVQQ